MPYRAKAKDILDMWRDEERRHAASEPASEEWLRTRFALDALRRAYQQAVEDARREDLPQPPPFPEPAG